VARLSSNDLRRQRRLGTRQSCRIIPRVFIFVKQVVYKYLGMNRAGAFSRTQIKDLEARLAAV